jgi:hypothetical protein
MVFGKKYRFHTGDQPGININPPFNMRIESGKYKIYILGAIGNPAVPGVPVQIVQFVGIQAAGEEFAIEEEFFPEAAAKFPVHNGGGEFRIRASGPYQVFDRFIQDNCTGEGLVRAEGKLFKRVSIGKMSQIVEKTGAEERTDPLWTEPFGCTSFGQVLKEPPAQMVDPYGVAGPGMGSAGIHEIYRSKLHNAVEPHKRGRGGQGRQCRGEIDMPPKNIPHRIGKSPG